MNDTVTKLMVLADEYAICPFYEGSWQRAKYLVDKRQALQDELVRVCKDSDRLDWLEQNLFHRENIDWITKKPCRKYNMWVTFSPIGVQGSARGIIDAAMESKT